MQKVTRHNIFKGMRITDKDGKKGTVLDCSDLHNVHVILDGKGLIIKDKEIDCGGSGLYCFVEHCPDNLEVYELNILE